jgi:hypothetical protein
MHASGKSLAPIRGRKRTAAKLLFSPLNIRRLASGTEMRYAFHRLASNEKSGVGGEAGQHR